MWSQKLAIPRNLSPSSAHFYPTICWENKPSACERVDECVARFILFYFILFYFCATPCACVISLAPKVVPGSSDIQRYNKPPAESKIQIRVRLHPHWIIAIGWAPHAGTWPFILGFFGHTPSIHIYYIWTLYTYPDTDMFISAYMLMPGMSAWLLIYTVCRSADFAACWWVFVSFRFVLRLPVGNLVFNIKGVGMGKK